jgi:glycerophosphoryl diester phosphodiesterase
MGLKIVSGLLLVLPLLALWIACSDSAGAAPRKIIIAHRGASGYLPEHTLEAVAAAHIMGADYLEQDVVLSKDSIPMVLHDIYIDTVTDAARRFPGRKRSDGRYYAIDFTLAELKQLRVTERLTPKTGQPVYPGRFPAWQASFEIPTLEEELQFVRGLNKSTGREAGVYPEIKKPAWHRNQDQDISRIVLEVLARYGYKTRNDRIYLQCFDFAEVKRIRNELGYKGKIVQLIGENIEKESSTDYNWIRTKQGLEEVAKVADGIGPSIQHVVAGKDESGLKITDLVKNAHDLKLEVHPYTFRSDSLPGYASSLEELFRIFFVRIGVDGAFTDYPDRGVAFVRGISDFGGAYD